MSETILVTGGAGYIGSHMVKYLLERGRQVVTLDDLSCGFRDAVLGGVFVQGDIGNAALLRQVFSRHRIDAVLHFAARSRVGESMVEPLEYYRHNVAAFVTLLQVMREHGVRRLVLSSSAAIYGAPEQVPIGEGQMAAPINPYGRSKWMAEQVAADAGRAHGLRWVALRYFNAAGADPEGMLGERHAPETHLIPLALQAAARGEPIAVFGRDWPTADGTAIRDYVHVWDLCEAHVLALEWLDAHAEGVFNVGVGRGYSVAEVIEAVARVSGLRIAIREAPRRPGDPPVLVADGQRGWTVLGWRPRRSELDTIIADAWRWQQRRVSVPVAKKA